MELLTQNSKMKKTSKEMGVRLFNFGITAYKSQSGKLTCPFADKCIKYCYAQKGSYSWGNVKPAFEKRYELTKTDRFVDEISKEIVRKKPDFIRVHDSGDYYSNKYRDKWFTLMSRFKDVKFYSYTNSIPLFRGKDLPDNFCTIYSDGGKLAHTIDKTTERHSMVFKGIDEMLQAGYVNASQNDLMATKWYNKTNKVGLKFH
tara:strand:- start:235 stop:840 length:606 start_codon:yes stop_codon:yes gene_type:complete